MYTDWKRTRMCVCMDIFSISLIRSKSIYKLHLLTTSKLTSSLFELSRCVLL